MASKAPKRAAYREHVQALKDAVASQAKAPIVLLYGSSEYLLGEALTTLRKEAVKAGAVVTSLEAPSLNEERLAALMSQASLFEPAAFYIIRRVESAKQLPKILKTLDAKTGTTNKLCFILDSDSPAAALKTELTRLKTKLVPCFAPWPNEVPQVLTSMAEDLKLKLRPDATSLLLEAIGDDLVKLNGELKKLALVLPAASEAWSAATIAPHLGMLREDDAFQLDRLLLQKQWAKAQALVTSLLERGESGLALLGILGSHCRGTLRVADAMARGISSQALAPAVRMPPFIAKTYAQYVNRQTDPRRYTRALELCREADVLLKSSRIGESLLIGRIIDALAQA